MSGLSWIAVFVVGMAAGALLVTGTVYVKLFAALLMDRREDSSTAEAPGLRGTPPSGGSSGGRRDR